MKMINHSKGENNMFNSSDYNENVIVCEYVWRKNLEYDLALEDAFDVQRVANLYADKLELGFGELVEDDIKLIKIAKQYVTREQMHKKGYRTVDDGSNRLFIDEITNRKGGYGFNESSDDQGLDEREEGLHL